MKLNTFNSKKTELLDSLALNNHFEHFPGLDFLLLYVAHNLKKHRND